PDHRLERRSSAVAHAAAQEKACMNGEHDKQWRMARRDFLRSSAALGVVTACSLAPSQGLAQGVPLQFDGSKFMLKPAEPNAKRGGVLRICVLSHQPHFDVHQSGTFANISTQACMFDNLIRRDPRDSGKSIILDLAHSWDISPDGTNTRSCYAGVCSSMTGLSSRPRTSRPPLIASPSRRPGLPSRGRACSGRLRRSAPATNT